MSTGATPSSRPPAGLQLAPHTALSNTTPLDDVIVTRNRHGSQPLDGLRLRDHSKHDMDGVYVVIDRPLTVTTAALGWDFDGTIANTESLLVSGPSGCYAGVVRNLLRIHQAVAQRHLDEKGKTFPELEGSKWEQEWIERRFQPRCSGGGYDSDALKLALALAEDYGIGVSYGDVRSAISSMMPRQLASVIDRIELIPGFRNKAESAHAAGISQGVCSASSIENIDPILHRQDVRRIFKLVLPEAIKKLANDAYSGQPYMDLFEQLNAKPTASCVIGDTPSDTGSGALAGAGIVVVRLNPASFDEDLENLVKGLKKLSDIHAVELGKGGTEVVVVRDYDPLSFEKSASADLPSSWRTTQVQ